MRRVVPCKVLARVVGYYRDVSKWNVGKQTEWKQRRIVETSYKNQSVK